MNDRVKAAAKASLMGKMKGMLRKGTGKAKAFGHDVRGTYVKEMQKMPKPLTKGDSEMLDQLIKDRNRARMIAGGAAAGTAGLGAGGYALTRNKKASPDFDKLAEGLRAYKAEAVAATLYGE